MDSRDKKDKDKKQDFFHPHDVWPPPPKKKDREFEKVEEREQTEEPVDPTDMMVYDASEEKNKKDGEDKTNEEK